MINKKWFGIKIIIFALILVISACSSSNTNSSSSSNSESEGEETKELVKWKHGIVSAKADSGFILMAKEKDYFKKHGVEVEFMEFEGDATMIQALIAGELDSMEANPAASINAINKGAKLKFIGSTMPGMPYALYTNSEIKSFKDLEGKIVGISKPGALPEIIVKAMLMEEGLDPASVTFVNAGGDVQRYQALMGGKVDAIASASEFVPQAEKDGINVLGYAADIVPMYPRFVIVSSEKALTEKPDAAAGFLAGEMEGLTYALNNRDEAIKLAAKTIDVPEDNVRINSIYDEVKEKGYLSPKSEIPVDRIEWLQDFLFELGSIEKKVDLNTVIDESFRKKALEMAEIE
ncbi:ABC transporter substrate-binding protein [Mesobacillus harenae]|uniref:ABC transporter substrate-binding protein n=1 Tax=Mesobacillus harenae TaxID=2213203 RepID=UPI0015809F49|nr:ABC transporter substrate-binding protein [Mesobacillus harenae]